MGIELAIFLTGLGRRVTILEMAPQLSVHEFSMHSLALFDQIDRCGISVHLSTRAEEITPTGIRAQTPEGRSHWRRTPSSMPWASRPCGKKPSLWPAAPQSFICWGTVSPPKTSMRPPPSPTGSPAISAGCNFSKRSAAMRITLNILLEALGLPPQPGALPANGGFLRAVPLDSLFAEPVRLSLYHPSVPGPGAALRLPCLSLCR